MQLTPTTLKAFEQHVLKEYPHEACGLIINDEFVPVPNTAADPLTTFRIDPLDYLAATAQGEVQAVLHSHPYNKFKSPKWPAEWPTTPDMTAWMEGGTPWGIVATCGEGITPLVWLDEDYVAPLIGREFQHGIHDCYSLIRDWYAINKNVKLPNYPRGVEWWHAGQNLYEDNFAKAGFVEVPLEAATVGDVVMMKAASPVTNHAAVIVGNNQILHHLFNRLSGVDSLSKWNRCIVRAVRYNEAKQQ